MTAIRRLFSEGFRVFFLAAAVAAILPMILWEVYLAVHAAGGMVSALPFAQAPHLWHAHEMIFGYAGAAIAGFLLTAAPNWTGERGARSAFLVVLAGVWLAGRAAMWVSASLPAGLVAVADLAFLPLLAANLARMILRRPKARQAIFLALLALLWGADLMTHLEWAGWTGDMVWSGLRMGLFTLVALIVILGGRVTPGFTRNAMVQSGRTEGLPTDRMPLAGVAIAAALSLPLAVALPLPDPVAPVLAIAAGTAALLRLAGWRGGWSARRPILWTLHLGYAMAGVGLVAWGLAGLGVGSEVAALHVIGIGAVGGMTIAVMSRATLGHSGRPLVAPAGLVAAYALVPAAAALRWAGSAWPDLYYPGVLGAGALWILAFTAYLAALWPAFWGERAPRAPLPPEAETRARARLAAVEEARP